MCAARLRACTALEEKYGAWYRNGQVKLLRASPQDPDKLLYMVHVPFQTDSEGLLRGLPFLCHSFTFDGQAAERMQLSLDAKGHTILSIHLPHHSSIPVELTSVYGGHLSEIMMAAGFKDECQGLIHLAYIPYAVLVPAQTYKGTASWYGVLDMKAAPFHFHV